MIYYIVRELGCDHEIALLSGLMLSLENALIVESRFILTDSISSSWALSLFLLLRRWMRYGKGRLLLPGQPSSALGVNQVGGHFYLGLVGVFFLVRLVAARSWRLFRTGLVAIIVIPAVIYMSLFAVHFAFLGNSGPGDAFDTPAFQKTLAGSAYADNVNLAPFSSSRNSSKSTK